MLVHCEFSYETFVYRYFSPDKHYCSVDAFESGIFHESKLFIEVQ